MKPTIICSLSGGRTSGYMTRLVKSTWSEFFDIKVCFANTGLEHEKTLEFVDRCDKEWGLNVVWLEASVNRGRKSTTYKKVCFDTASRNGRPFNDVCSKYGIPNKNFLHCTRETKLNPMMAWRKAEVGYAYFAVGIRLDEVDRMSSQDKEKGIIYPLISAFPSRKADVMAFWDKQAFDLGLPEHLGNCVACHKKSDRKLALAYQDAPQYFDLSRQLEHDYSNVISKNEIEPRKMYRKKRSTDELIASFDINDDSPNGCSEQCDAFCE